MVIHLIDHSMIDSKIKITPMLMGSNIHIMTNSMINSSKTIGKAKNNLTNNRNQICSMIDQVEEIINKHSIISSSNQEKETTIMHTVIKINFMIAIMRALMINSIIVHVVDLINMVILIPNI